MESIKEYKLGNLTLIEEEDGARDFGCDSCCLDTYDSGCAYGLADMGLHEDYCALQRIHFIQKES